MSEPRDGAEIAPSRMRRALLARCDFFLSVANAKRVFIRVFVRVCTPAFYLLLCHDSSVHERALKDKILQLAYASLAHDMLLEISSDLSLGSRKENTHAALYYIPSLSVSYRVLSHSRQSA